MAKTKWHWIMLVCSGIILFTGAACFIPREDSSPEPIPVEAPQQPVTETINLLAAGDCLMHNTQIWSGEREDGTYNFDFFFSEVAPIIQSADYASTCFEAPMAGPSTGYTNYPRFNSPDAAADAFKKAGFDLIVTANNHAFDRDYLGAMRTLQVLHQAGLDTVGTYASMSDSQSFLIKNLKGVKVGYLAYSYGTNGISVPEDKRYCFNFLEEDRVLADIQRLRPQVDILMLILHWGVEYQTRPETWQEEMAHRFLSAGADVILGSHPHVIQTMEVVPDGDTNKYVIYSMGNFISHQNGIERNSGIILNLKFIKYFDIGVTELVKVDYVPTYSHAYYDENGQRKFRVVAVEPCIEGIIDGSEPYLTEADLPTLKEILASTRGQLGEPFNRDGI